MKDLREYQEKIVEKVVNSDKDLIVCLPTGAGKTVVAGAIIEKLDTPVVFIVPRLELINQAKSEFEEQLGEPVDMVWADKTKLTGAKCIVASKDSLRTQKDRLPDEVILFFDEVHMSLEQSYKLVQSINPVRVLGLTATPERMDGYALIKDSETVDHQTHKFGIFDELIQEETVPSLIKKGYLSQLHYYARPIDGITEIRPDNTLGEELSDDQMRRIFTDNNVWGDLVASYETYGKGRPTIGFTNTIKMAEQVADIFNNAGYDFRVITGEMSVKERKSLIDGLASGEIDGLVNAALLTYGFDCPPVSYAFSCRHIKSRPLWFQMVGRILRICEGKEDAIFIDHGDSISEFAEPDCSLPILDETIKWKIHGETKEEKQARKRGMKKVQDTMKLIQELDPLPSQMVEVTMEDTWERLIRIIKRQREENDYLLNQNNRLANKDIENTEIIRTMSRKNMMLEARMEQTARDNENNERTIRYIEEERKRLAAKNKELIESIKEGNITRYVNPDRTFEYCRKNYCNVRNECKGTHEETVSLLIERAKDLPFLLDMTTFRKSMSYWEANFKPRSAYRKEQKEQKNKRINVFFEELNKNDDFL